MLYEGVGRRLTLALKHSDRLDIARPAAIWMRRAGRPLIDGADLIAPVPLHWTRLAKRRGNQSATLAREVARLADRRDALIPDLLECHLMAGSADYLLKLSARDTDDFARIHRRYLARLPGVTQMHSSFSLKTVCHTTALPV